jgi:hypothetical protein
LDRINSGWYHVTITEFCTELVARNRDIGIALMYHQACVKEVRLTPSECRELRDRMRSRDGCKRGAGVRTFAITALLGTLTALANMWSVLLPNIV